MTRGAAEAFEAGCLERVHHARNERPLGTDDGQIDVLGAGEPDETREIIRLNLCVADAWLRGCTCVARCDQYFADAGR